MKSSLYLVMATLFSTAHAAEAPRTLTVIAITDFHGALAADTVKTAVGEPLQTGGAALLAAYVKKIQSHASGPSIIIDAGDLFQGTLESNLAKGKPVIKFFNALHVAAAAVGNHEFDFGPVGDDAQGALKERTQEADFPFLAANVTDDAGGTPAWARRSVITVRDGVRIGIVGAATPDTPNTTMKTNLRGLHFADPLESVAREARELRERGHVDVVILTFHGGGACKNNSPEQQDDLSSCDEGELFRLLRALPAGLIDVAVGGHTHQGIAKRLSGTAVLQAFARGKQLGWAEVPLGNATMRPRIAGFASVCGAVVGTPAGPSCLPTAIRESHGPVTAAQFLGAEIGPDSEISALIAPDLERVRVLKQTPIGIAALTPITRAYNEESALGNLTADAMHLAVSGAELAVTNGGGLRADLPPGALAYGHIFEMLPFENRLATMVVNGATLKRMVELGHAGNHGALLWSHLGFTAQSCNVTAIEVNGQPLQPAQSYRVVTNDYLASGGSGFDHLDIDPTQIQILWDNAFILRDVVARRLHDLGHDIASDEFFTPAAPRQKITGSCKKPE